MWLSEPMAIAPPAVRKSMAGKMPSPRLASVVGHSPAIAPDRASASVSAAVMCVAWIAVQRSERSNSRSSISTGRRPEKARQSSTSFTCSATWMWIGASGGKAAMTSRSSAGVTARSECGRDADAAERCALACIDRLFDDPQKTLRTVDETALPRRGGWPPKPPWA